MPLILRALSEAERVDPASPPEDLVPAAGLRGIALYWRPATDSPWSVQRVVFSAVSPSRQDDPPADVEALERYVRAAYVLAACAHPIPSDAETFYEVRW
jgi:hypothetical protein